MWATDRKNEPLSPLSSHLTLPSVNPSGLPVRARLAGGRSPK